MPCPRASSLVSWNNNQLSRYQVAPKATAFAGMSIKFHWDKLGTQHEEQARQFLNDFFRNIKKPDFIGDIVVTSLTFG